MLFRELFRILGLFLMGLAIPLLFPLAIAIYTENIVGPAFYPQPSSLLAFILTIATTLIVGALFYLLGRKSEGKLYRKEALLLVLLIYLSATIMGALPFLYSRTLTNPADAIFEVISGYTTTGATIMEGKKYDPVTHQEIALEKTIITGTPTTYRYFGNIEPVVDEKTGEVIATGIEAVSPALLIWRGETQWLGGGGIVILFLALFPILGIGGKVLYQTETTGPSKETMTPRIKETASSLWKIYLGLTVLQVLLLMITNGAMPFLDALNITFATLSTGGFAPKNLSIAAYNNAYTDWIVILFMLLGSISFSIYFFCMKGKFRKLNDPELKLFLALFVVISLLATFQLYNTPRTPLQGGGEGNYTFFEALRFATFQITSSYTTTGFSTANFDLWPFSPQLLILLVMFIGGMAGSTAGGIKVIRLQLFFRILVEKIETLFRPDVVRSYHLGPRIIEEKTASTTLTFILLVITVAVLGTFLLVFDGVDPESSFATTLCMLSNCGFAFRMGGPETNFDFLSNFGKILSSLEMLAGRLEYFALLIILLPSFWKKS